MLAFKETKPKMVVANSRTDGKRVNIKAAYKDAMKKYPKTMNYLAK